MKIHIRLSQNLFLLFLIFTLFTSCTTKETPCEMSTDFDVINYVDPFIGTGFHGHTFPGPVMPHGMIQLGPDTKLNGWDASSGYHYGDSIIYGFSHTHLSGTGIGDMGDVLFLPFTGELKEKPIATFKKSKEYSKVGYYAVEFDNYNVKAALTTTTRAGLHRYYYGDGEKRLLVDLGHILQATWGNSNLYNELKIIDNKTIRGLKHTRGWAKDHRVYFYAEFSSPFTLDEVFIDDTRINDRINIVGTDVFAYFSFKELKAHEPLLIRVGISAVDEQGAKINLQTELTDWNFEEVQQNVEDAWRNELNKIKVCTKNTDDLSIFYTALYHSMIAPAIFQDVDGRYRGMDLKIHTAKEGTINYTIFSLWDTFRALHPLMTIIDEELSRDWVNNLLIKYQEGDFLPKWPLAANYTATMVGYPAVANIADALNKNISGIDIKLALEASINSALYKPELIENTISIGKRKMMPLYNKFVNEGTFIPADSIVKSVSYGLEMAYYDWCISEIAKQNNDKENTLYFEKRAQYYKNYFDAETGFMRGRNADGSWALPFNPKHSSHRKSYYIEGNAWQWTWFAPHDIDGFMELFGDRNTFIQKLDTLFSTSSEVFGEDASADITGLIGQYAHGNEPSHHIAYLYTYAGQPWKTQEIVDKILKEFYSSKPDGIIGNEDCGQMSAWYILNAMGFYQFAPGNPVYTIARPIFDKVEIPLASGKIFTIISENNSKENKYVQAVYINGKLQNDLLFTHEDIKNGVTIRVIMGPQPKYN